jgi:hypothetical protein
MSQFLTGATQETDGSWTITINGSVDPPPQLSIPAGTGLHAAWQQVLAFCVQNGVRVIPQFIFINASGTTGTVVS